MINSVYDLIDDIGKSVTLRSVTTGVYDPSTGGVSESTNDQTVRAMFLSYKDNNRDDSLILRGDRKIVIAARDVSREPSLEDLVISGGNSYRLKNIRIIENNDSDVVYVCQGRPE